MRSRRSNMGERWNTASAFDLEAELYYAYYNLI